MFGPHRPACEIPAPAPAAEPTRSRPHRDARRWVLPVTVLGSSMGFIDGSVVNVALPAIQRELGSGLAAVQWVVSGYMLTLGSLILIGGSAGDRFGRRRIFLIGLVGFGLASLACALAPDADTLIAARLVQGAAAALVTPSSLAIISAAYTGRDRGAAIGTWAAAGAITTALGPPLGGWLVDHAGWRAVFYINVPIALVAVLLAFRLPADRPDRSADSLDWPGALLVTLALALASYGMIALGEAQWATGWVALGAALPLAALFLWVEMRAQAPMMPLRLFADARFAGANALTVVLYAGLSAGLFVLPYALIRQLGFSAMAAGLGFLPFSIVMGFGSRLAGRLVEPVGARVLLTGGPALTAGGFAVLAWFAGSPSYWTGYLPGLLLVAVGMTLTVAPLTTVVFDAAPAEASGAASGINNAAARIGGLLAVAALGLAFGGGEASGDVAHGYRLVVGAAAVLALLGAGLAAVTIRSPTTAEPQTR